MKVSKRDIFYRYEQVKLLISGWTEEQQIQFHLYAIKKLKEQLQGRLIK